MHSTDFVCLCMAAPIFFTTPYGKRQGPVSDQQKADGYLSCSRRAQTGMTLPEKLNKTRQPVTNRASFGCVKRSEEVHVILNRFYIVQEIFILPDFADGRVLFTHKQTMKCYLPPQGGKLSPMFARVSIKTCWN